MIQKSAFKKLSIFLALGILTALSLVVLWPLASAIIFGLILAYIFYPVYKMIFSFIKEKNTSAMILILLVILLVFIPFWFILPIALRQIFDFYLYMQKIDFFALIEKFFPFLLNTNFPQDIVLSLNKAIISIASKTFSSASSYLLNIPTLALKTIVVLFVFFFGMRDSETFTKYAASLSPFSKSAEKEFVQRFKDITKAVIYGQAIIGIIQGLLTGLGLLVFNVPQTLLLTVIAMLVSMVPVVGAWLVWFPSSIYLLATNHVTYGIILLLYGAIFISWVDNLLRPYLIAKKTKLSTAIVLIGMIGGLIVFGVLGLIIGPLILSYLLLVLDAYRNRKIPTLFHKNK